MKRHSPMIVVGLVGLVLATLLGVRLAVPMLARSGAGAATPPLADPAARNLTLGQPVRTSFGSITATEAEVNDGLSSADIGGMSHGVSSLVSTGHAQVNVVVTLRNSSRRAVGTAAGQFRLLTGRGGAPVGRPVPPQATSMQAGRLVPGSAVDARVTFVTPTNGSQLWLQYADPAGGRPIRIGLGSSTPKISAPGGSHH